MTFQDTAVESARIYHQYLIDNNGSLDIYEVAAISTDGEIFIFTLSDKLKSPETTQVKIYNEIYTQEQIKPVEYDKKRRTLKVRPLKELSERLRQVTARDIRVISDLRFLVKRVEDWYREFGHYLEFPTEAPDVAAKESIELRTGTISFGRSAMCYQGSAFNANFLCLGSTGYRQDALCFGKMHFRLYPKRKAGFDYGTDE